MERLQKAHAEWLAAKAAAGAHIPRCETRVEILEALRRVSAQLTELYHQAAELEAQLYSYLVRTPALSDIDLAEVYMHTRQVADIGESLRYLYGTRETPPASSAVVNNTLAMRLFVQGMTQEGNFSLTAHGKTFTCSGTFSPRVPGKRDPNRARLFAWLREQGGESMIFEDISYRDLSNFIRDRAIPDWLYVYAIPTVQIRDGGPQSEHCSDVSCQLE